MTYLISPKKIWKNTRRNYLETGQCFLKKQNRIWKDGLASGALSKADFEFLLKGKKDLAEMEALKQLGLSKIRITKITNGIIDVIAGSAIKTFLYKHK